MSLEYIHRRVFPVGMLLRAITAALANWPVDGDRMLQIADRFCARYSRRRAASLRYFVFELIGELQRRLGCLLAPAPGSR